MSKGGVANLHRERNFTNPDDGHDDDNDYDDYEYNDYDHYDDYGGCDDVNDDDDDHDDGVTNFHRGRNFTSPSFTSNAISTCF